MPDMSPEDVNAFLDQMGWSDSEAERRTGITRKSIAKYRREGAPLVFALACAALAAELPAWTRIG